MYASHISESGTFAPVVVQNGTFCLKQAFSKQTVMVGAGKSQKKMFNLCAQKRLSDTGQALANKRRTRHITDV